MMSPEVLLIQGVTSDAGPLETLVGQGLFVAGICLGAFALTRLLRLLIRRLLERFAQRSRQGASDAWLARSPRMGGETDTLALLRRDQRVRATATMLSRIVNVGVWLLALFIMLAGLEVDVVWAVSSAGFLGAAIAIGGQHSVHDYVNGLHILLEDRFGEGDTISVGSAEEERVGVVERLGTFSTRLKGDHATWHIANRHMAEVLNLSQHSTRIDVGITVAGEPNSVAVRRALVQALGDVAKDGRENVTVVVDRVEARKDRFDPSQNFYRIKGRTSAAVTTTQHEELAKDLARRLQE